MGHGVQAGARVEGQPLDGDRDAVELGGNPGRQLDGVGGLRQTVVGAAAQQTGDTGGFAVGGDHHQGQHLALRRVAYLLYDLHGVLDAAAVEGDDRVGRGLFDAAAHLARDGVGDRVAGGFEGAGEPFTPGAGGADRENAAL